MRQTLYFQSLLTDLVDSCVGLKYLWDKFRAPDKRKVSRSGAADCMPNLMHLRSRGS